MSDCMCRKAIQFNDSIGVMASEITSFFHFEDVRELFLAANGSNKTQFGGIL